jgi:peptidyl-prolyl cis-trans isomerase C
MRAHIWAISVLAGVIAVTGAARAQTDPKAVVATANGTTITMGEVETVLKARGIDLTKVPPERVSALRYEVVCTLIDGRLWEEYLKKNGPRVEPAAVNQHMAELAGWVKKHNKTMDDYYKDSGQTETSVRAGITSILQWEAIARGKVNDADLKRYYDDNKDYFDRVWVRASHIAVRLPANAPAAEKQAARDKLLAIRAHIVAGKLDFAEAAKRYSQDATAQAGGDIGLFPRKMVVPESIAKAAFALPVKGVSDVVESDYGLHLVTVTERKPPERPSEYEKVKEEVRDACYGELQLSVLAQLRTDARIEIKLPK